MLLYGQTLPSENGVYIMGENPGETVRTSEASGDDQFLGSLVVVK